jgi:hypothetical protein
MGQFSGTLQGACSTIRLVSGGTPSLTQNFEGSASKRTRGKVSSSRKIDYRTEYNISILFGETACDAVKVAWTSRSIEREADEPEPPKASVGIRPCLISFWIILASKT